MLTRVELRTPNGTILSLPLGDISNGYSVQGIDGLDPVPASIVSSSFARLDGEQFQSVRRDKRNIILRIGLESDYVSQSVYDLRSALYQFVTPKMEVTLRFYSDLVPVVEIKGVAESFSAPLFAREPMATISILCLDPNFYEPIQTVVEGQTTNGSITGIINYTGTIETGVHIYMRTPAGAAPQTGFSIFNQPQGKATQKFEVVNPITQGQRYYISSIPGDKYAELLTMQQIRLSILSGVSPYSDWITLQPGENYFRFQMGGAARDFELTYTKKHGGL